MNFCEWYSVGWFMFLSIISVVLIIIMGANHIYSINSEFIESINYKCDGKLSFGEAPIFQNQFGQTIIRCDSRILTSLENKKYNAYINSKSRIFMVGLLIIVLLSILFFVLVLPYIVYIISKLYKIYFKRITK